MRLFHRHNTTARHRTASLERRSRDPFQIGIGLMLCLATIGGAADLVRHARWPWPDDALQDPVRVQLVVSFLLACTLLTVLVQIIKAHPHTEEQFDD